MVVTVAVSANTQYAIREIADRYHKSSGQNIRITTGSSGKLSTQIANGAPFDIFISADTEYPAYLDSLGSTLATPRIYAWGSLVIWAPSKGNDFEPINELLNGSGKIAIANPLNAPYGRAALEALEHIDPTKGYMDRLVYGESITQTTQFISTGAAKLGITAKSAVMYISETERGYWMEVDPATYQPLAQAACLIKRMDGPVEEADKFFNFLFSEESRKVFREFGYEIELKE